jgi:hypothetical protein
MTPHPIYFMIYLTTLSGAEAVQLPDISRLPKKKKKKEIAVILQWSDLETATWPTRDTYMLFII